MREPGLATLAPQEGDDRRFGRLLAILWVRSGRKDVSQYAVRSPVATLGRDPENDLVIDSPAVSAHHATLSLAEGVWTLTDQGSINGSWVDGERVEGALQLAPGSELRIADVVFSFAPRDEWRDSPAPVETPALQSAAIAAPTFLIEEEPSTARRIAFWATLLSIGGIVAYLMLTTR